MSDQISTKEAKKLLLTERCVQYISTGCHIPNELRDEASKLGINLQALTMLVKEMYEEEVDESECSDESKIHSQI